MIMMIMIMMAVVTLLTTMVAAQLLQLQAQRSSLPAALVNGSPSWDVTTIDADLACDDKRMVQYRFGLSFLVPPCVRLKLLGFAFMSLVSLLMRVAIIINQLHA